MDGDFFLRTDTHCLWGPKASGEWPGTCASLVGPVNTTAISAGQKGSYYPYGIGYSSAGTAYFGAGGANHGYRVPLVIPAALEFRSIGVYITAASGTCGGTCGAVITIRSNDLTSIVVQSAVLVSGGTPNINASAQGVGFPVSSGSAVSGGVATLPAGSYWLCFDSDSTTLAISNIYTSANVQGVVDGSAGSGVHPVSIIGSMAGSTGSGSSIAPVVNISGATWPSMGSGAPPMIAFHNYF